MKRRKREIKGERDGERREGERGEGEERERNRQSVWARHRERVCEREKKVFQDQVSSNYAFELTQSVLIAGCLVCLSTFALGRDTRKVLKHRCNSKSKLVMVAGTMATFSTAMRTLVLMELHVTLMLEKKHYFRKKGTEMREEFASNDQGHGRSLPLHLSRPWAVCLLLESASCLRRIVGGERR